MPLLIVRHAVALRRKDWTKDDRLRPLTPRGYEQAAALPAQLSTFTIGRVLSSPYVRCVETVEPLVARLGLPLEHRDELAEGAGAAAAALLDGITGDGAVVLCTHGDVVPDLLDVVAPEAIASGDDLPCEKGSTWVVEDGGRRASYLAPPA